MKFLTALGLIVIVFLILSDIKFEDIKNYKQGTFHYSYRDMRIKCVNGITYYWGSVRSEVIHPSGEVSKCKVFNYETNESSFDVEYETTRVIR